MNNMFYGAPNIVDIDFTETNLKIGTSNGSFFSCKVLKNIFGEFDFSEASDVNNMFDRCEALEEFRIKNNTLSLSLSFSRSSKLSAETVQSIIDGLATVETAQTLTLHKNIVLTDEQKATIESKGWTLVQ
jgi:hypothetical protein